MNVFFASTTPRPVGKRMNRLYASHIIINTLLMHRPAVDLGISVVSPMTVCMTPGPGAVVKYAGRLNIVTRVGRPSQKWGGGYLLTCKTPDVNLVKKINLTEQPLKNRLYKLVGWVRLQRAT